MKYYNAHLQVLNMQKYTQRCLKHLQKHHHSIGFHYLTCQNEKLVTKIISKRHTSLARLPYFGQLNYTCIIVYILFLLIKYQKIIHIWKFRWFGQLVFGGVISYIFRTPKLLWWCHIKEMWFAFSLGLTKSFCVALLHPVQFSKILENFLYSVQSNTDLIFPIPVFSPSIRFMTFSNTIKMAF